MDQRVTELKMQIFCLDLRGSKTKTKSMHFLSDLYFKLKQGRMTGKKGYKILIQQPVGQKPLARPTVTKWYKLKITLKK
jgi:predicted aminopeptidase